MLGTCNTEGLKYCGSSHLLSVNVLFFMLFNFMANPCNTLNYMTNQNAAIGKL